MTETDFKPPTYAPVSGTPADPEVQHEARTQHRVDPDGKLHMMTEIGDGVFVQWSQCARCMKRVGECPCAGGPQEPEYMQRWRTQRFTKSFAERGIDPRATPYAVRELLAEAQEAADAAYGDSNDSEIELLRGVAEGALALLGLSFPEGRDPDDEEEDEDEDEDEFPDDPDNLTGMDVGDGVDAEPLARPSTVFERVTGNVYDVPEDSGIVGVGTPPTGSIDTGMDAALAAVRDKKEEPDVGF